MMMIQFFKLSALLLCFLLRLPAPAAATAALEEEAAAKMDEEEVAEEQPGEDRFLVKVYFPQGVLGPREKGCGCLW